MSESPKMGLFGSKDKETKKDDSSGRYAPYCIDSDSETYDTEALSIMDINDIIGVQSDPVSDSTLESEIAALSQIITESKTDCGQNTLEFNVDARQTVVTTGEELPLVANIDKTQIYKNDAVELKTYVEETCASNTEKLNQENKQYCTESILQENIELTEEQKEGDTKYSHDTILLTDSSSKNNENMNKLDMECIESISKFVLGSSNLLNSEKIVQKSSVNQEEGNSVEVETQDSKITTIESESNLCTSLQLIGEAYSSEDSQETNTNISEPKEMEPLFASTKDCSTNLEEKETISEFCESEQSENNTYEMSDKIDLVKSCTNTDISVETTDNEVRSVESNENICPMTSEDTGKLSTTIETVKGTTSNECKESNTTQCEEKINVDINEKDNVSKEVEQSKGDSIEVIDSNVLIQQFDVEVKEKTIQTSMDTCDIQQETFETISKVNINEEKEKENEECMKFDQERSDESTTESMDVEEQEIPKHEEEIVKEREDYMNTEKEENHCGEEIIKINETEIIMNEEKEESSESVKHMDVEKETIENEQSEEEEENQERKECINEEIEKNQHTEECANKEVEDRQKSEEQLNALNIECNADSDTINIETNEKIVQEEKESKAELPEYLSINIELPHFPKQETIDSEILQDEMKISQTEEEVCIKELEITEELLDTSVSKLSPKELNQNLESSEENSESIVHDLKSSTSEDVHQNVASKDSNIQTEDKSIDLASVEVEVKNPLADESEDVETKPSPTREIVQQDMNLFSMCETVEVNDLQLDSVSTMDISTPEDNFESKINSVCHNETEKKEIENSTSGEPIQELNEVTMTEGFSETKDTLDGTDISKEHTVSDTLDIPEKFEDLNVNLPKDEGAEMQALDKKKEESSPVKIVIEAEQSTVSEVSELKEPKGTHDITEEESLEKIPENNTETITENEGVQIERFDLNQEEVSTLSHTENLEPEEDARQRDVEETNVTSEPEETVSKSGVEKTDEKSEEVEEVGDEILKETPKDSTKDIVDTQSLNIEESPLPIINSEGTVNLDNTEDLVPTPNEELTNREHDSDNNLKSYIDKDNAKDILETANNMEEIFSGEQCQSTQDIVTSILSDVRNTSDFTNILSAEANVTNDIENVLKESTELPLVETEIAELTEKLPQDSEDILSKDMEDPISTQNIESLEGLLGLDLIPDGEEPALKIAKPEEQTQEQETLSKDVDMSLLLEQGNNSSDVAPVSDYITDVISSCLTEKDTEKDKESESIDDKDREDEEPDDTLKIVESIIPETMNKDTAEDELQTNTDLPENELDMDFEEAPLESVEDLEEAEAKLELAQDILLQNVEQSENLNEAQTVVETSQPSSEISELESAVKFLQESEEQAMDSPLVLSPKMVESVVDDISKQTDASALFVPDEDMCEDTAELETELHSIATDSISISEAEIISEAAKLESERKLAEQEKLEASMSKFEAHDDDQEIVNEEKITAIETDTKFSVAPIENIETQQAPNLESEKVPETITPLPQSVLKTSESIPKMSILEERLKEPPKIEIPSADMSKVSMSPTTSKDSLLIQKDAKLFSYQKMLESPKLSEKSEPRIMETPRKDSEKHDFENVGSPRIILKIAKSAITDCGEPRSPKSPKIRSATNSPNPEDSPGQKLGKIKLKLSKGGHPSIISNENIEEAGQWHSEGSSSLSPIGMKIKFSKSGDASIVSSEKHDAMDDLKEGKHKFEEAKRTESPIGMKIKLSKTGDASIVQQDSKEVQMKHKDKLDIVHGSPKRTESPIGMKIKLSKTGDASIIQPERQDLLEEHRDNPQLKAKDKLEAFDSPKRTDSPIGMKIKLSKTGDASIVSPDVPDESREACKSKDKSESPPDLPKRTDSPIGMKIKLTKIKGGASIISMENPEESKDKLEIPDTPKRTESPLGMKIKLSKTGDASIVHSEISEEIRDAKLKEKVEMRSETVQIKLEPQEASEEADTMQESVQKLESPIGMKIKLSKFGDASIVSTEKQEQFEDMKPLPETPKRTESPIGMKIKLSKTGDASIIQPETSEDINKTTRTADAEHSKATDAGLGMKIKLLKTGDASIVDPEKKEKQQRRRDTESPLEMKIKLSKTGHPTIIACDNHGDSLYKSKEAIETSHGFAQRYQGSPQAAHKEPALKILKTGHSTILQSNRSELTIEPVRSQAKALENVAEIPPKRKEITISPVEAKKSKLEAQLTQMLPEVTIQPVASRDQKQFMFDPKSSAISLQQMNVISQEISITQVRPQKPLDPPMNEKLKDMLSKNASSSPMNSDCEIIENRPELIIVNENSNSSQDVVIIEEVSPTRPPEIKVPKRRGRPRRNPMAQPIVHAQVMMPRDPLPLDEAHQQPQVAHLESRENERPKRTCRSQKSYAPPKRGRGRGRGKRKLDSLDLQIIKKPRIEQDLTAIEASTTAVISLEGSVVQHESFEKSPELYKALKQPPMDSRITSPTSKAERKAIALKGDGTKTISLVNSILPDSASALSEIGKELDVRAETVKAMPKPISIDLKDNKDKKMPEIIPERIQKTTAKSPDEKSDKTTESARPENKDILVPPGHPNWLTPISKRPAEGSAKHENVSTVQVIDEETRMSAESGSRSQTPARNISAQASETIVNEESQGSVLSTATTESEKVKVKNRRMEINFDPDEGPFTVDKIAEYEWPLDRKGETFMIQEQISQYLGVKSFKRKYPDLKRRVVDMEERNYLRENGLVSEAMCDMGLTAICSSEVLDVMCSDFPDQYEEYRKHMREKQVKEHSKKQKELSAAANAEKNRIDLAEMAVQSALTWNINLNKARKENRKCSLDLQTLTIHVPKKQQKVDAERKIGHYPVALIPGQYTDYYREYTPAELRYYPLNTVLYGPMRPNERKFDSQSEGSQSDSDSDSSSDDSSSSSSEGTQDTEGSQSTMDDVDMEIVHQKEEVKLKCKMCLKTLNKHSKNEVLIQCGTCNGHVHPSCIDLTLDMVPHIQSYAWQCTDCKTCAQCHDPADEDKMLFCDMCDRGYHIYCVGLRRVPQGRWHCQECAVCANCGSREPGGVNSDRNSVAQWQHEYKKGEKNTRVYVSTLCVPCSKLWRKGRYCPHCSRCHTAPRLDLEANLVHCSACDKYLHLGCVETKGMGFDRKNYLCDFCTPNRQVTKPLILKTMRT